MKELNIIDMQKVEAGDSCTTAWVLWGLAFAGAVACTGGAGIIFAFGGFAASTASIPIACA